MALGRGHVIEFKFRGLMAPVFTPFDEKGNLNLGLIQPYAEYLFQNEIKGVLVNGTSGEGVSMTTSERLKVVKAWADASQSLDLALMVQVGGTSAADVKNLAGAAAACGATAILCLADLFFRPTSLDDLIRYLNLVSASAPSTPLLYYHIPSFTGINLDMSELMKRRGEVNTLVGIKFTDTDLAMGAGCLNALSPDGEKPAVFLGCDNLFLPALIQGFDSAIGTTINIFPTINNKILKYFKEGNISNATQEQKYLNNLIEKITEQGSWVSSMKAAMRKLSPIDVGPVRDPLITVSHGKINLNL